MAIDKSRTKPWMKGVIIFIIIAFVMGVAAIPVASLMSGTPTTTTTTGQAGQSSQTTSQAIEAIALQYTPVIKAREASLAADPENYDLNVLQGQTYFDWAAGVMQSTQGQQGADIWKAALPFYQKALKIKPGDPNVTTDYAIALYYSGDVPGAIATAEGVLAKDAKFAPAYFNLGIFYQAAGDNAKGKIALTKYLELEPEGQNAQGAKDMLSNLK